MGQRFNPQPIARYDQSLLPALNQNFEQLSRLLASIPTESIGPTAPDNPYVGQQWVDTNTFTIKVWTGSAWLPDLWTTFTPAISQGATLTKTIGSSRYEKRGRTVNFAAHWNITSAGTAGSQFLCTLPVNLQDAGNRCVGSGFYYNGAINVSVDVYAPLVGSVGFIRRSTGTELGASGTTAAAGHALTFTMCYEANA